MLWVLYMLGQALKIWVSIFIYEDELEYANYVDVKLKVFSMYFSHCKSEHMTASLRFGFLIYSNLVFRDISCSKEK